MHFHTSSSLRAPTDTDSTFRTYAVLLPKTCNHTLMCKISGVQLKLTKYKDLCCIIVDTVYIVKKITHQGLLAIFEAFKHTAWSSSVHEVYSV